jgi:hypothetical protein
MKPNPLASLNHLTVPCSIVVIPLKLLEFALEQIGVQPTAGAENQSVAND